MNGKRGCVVEYLSEHERFKVRVIGTEELVGLRPCNLTEEPPPAPEPKKNVDDDDDEFDIYADDYNDQPRSLSPRADSSAPDAKRQKCNGNEGLTVVSWNVLAEAYTKGKQHLGHLKPGWYSIVYH